MHRAAATRFTSVEKAKLLAIENDATKDQTAAEILTALLTVDGPNSGLDADLLDGQTRPQQVAALNWRADQQTAVNTLADARIAVKLSEAVNGNTERGITVTYGSDGTIDFTVDDEPSRNFHVGWSADTSISAADVLAGADATARQQTIPAETVSQYLFVWRPDVDGGDPSEVLIGGGGGRNQFGAATALSVGGVAGHLIISETTLNASLLSGESLRVT